MTEYIIEIPDEYFASYDTERDMYYPDERDSAMPITPFVRCRDCAYRGWSEAGGYFCARGIGLTVDPDGFCKWAKRRDE